MKTYTNYNDQTLIMIELLLFTAVIQFGRAVVDGTAMSTLTLFNASFGLGKYFKSRKQFVTYFVLHLLCGVAVGLLFIFAGVYICQFFVQKRSEEVIFVYDSPQFADDLKLAGIGFVMESLFCHMTVLVIIGGTLTFYLDIIVMVVIKMLFGFLSV